MKKNKTIQIRVSEEEKEMVNSLCKYIPDFQLSNFVRKHLREFYAENKTNIKEKGIGFLKIQ